MSTDSASFFDAALNLPVSERATLAYELLRSLDPPAALKEEDPQFFQEIVRRAEEYEAGRAEASDWNDVADRLRGAIREKGPQ